MDFDQLLHSVRIIDFPTFFDPRGYLTVIENKEPLPVDFKRLFYIYKASGRRGEHAHANADQLLIALHGEFTVKVSTPDNHKTFKLDNPSSGLFIPRYVFIEIYDFSDDAVCLVLTNTYYDENQYIQGWSNYTRFMNDLKQTASS